MLKRLNFGSKSGVQSLLGLKASNSMPLKFRIIIIEKSEFKSRKAKHSSNYYIFESNISKQMTEIGKFLNKKSVNKAEISRRTGISTSRLSELSLKESTRLTVEELYLIALAIDIEPRIVLEEVCKNIGLASEK